MVAAPIFNTESEMTYQVLARKWRPKRFDQIVGQEHVSQSLIHALQHDRLHHAYLFTGTRGVGKTTIARILAKAVNCENLKDSNPCGVCRVCRDFEQGRFMDLIEVDAASRTKVEDTRDLLDNAQYAPNQGRYKVYLIDEVHMLSGHSFNALLKTLEEPPAHVKFLLATTDPQKIPVTVLSRCLQFNLKRLFPEQISAQLSFILQQEQIDFEQNAVRLLSRAADGSMRDGLSLLDQAIAYGDGKVVYTDVLAMLGTVAQQPVDELLQALADNDATTLLKKIDEVASLTPDFKELLQQVVRVLHRVAISQQLPELVDQEFDRQLIDYLISRLKPEDVQLFYQIGLIGLRDLDLAPDPRSGFEMVMLRMLTFKPKKTGNERHLARQAPAIFPQQQKNTSYKTQVEQPVSAHAQKGHIAENSVLSDNWPDIIKAIKVRGMTKELANNCTLAELDTSECRLTLDPGHKNLSGGKAQEKLQKALQDYYGRPIKLMIAVDRTAQETPAIQMEKQRESLQQAAVDAINRDEDVRALKEQFDARVMPGSIEPNN